MICMLVAHLQCALRHVRDVPHGAEYATISPIVLHVWYSGLQRAICGADSEDGLETAISAEHGFLYGCWGLLV